MAALAHRNVAADPAPLPSRSAEPRSFGRAVQTKRERAQAATHGSAADRADRQKRRRYVGAGHPGNYRIALSGKSSAPASAQPLLVAGGVAVSLQLWTAGQRLEVTEEGHRKGQHKYRFAQGGRYRGYWLTAEETQRRDQQHVYALERYLNSPSAHPAPRA